MNFKKIFSYDKSYYILFKLKANPDAFSTLLKSILTSLSKLIDHDLAEPTDLKKMKLMGKLTTLAFTTDESINQKHLTNQEIHNFVRTTLKNILEVTRKLEDFENEYHSAAQKLINLCLRYKYKGELRRVCYTLRTHVAQIISDDAEGIAMRKGGIMRNVKTATFKNFKTLQINMQTRIHSFNACIKLNMWRDSYFCLEEIFQMMNAKTILNLNSAKLWFELLMKIAGTCLITDGFDHEMPFSMHQKFTALAFLKAFDTVDKARGPPEDLKKQVATSAFLSSISVLDYSKKQSTTDTIQKDTFEKLFDLLRTQKVPELTQDYIFEKAFSTHILQYLPNEIKQLGFLLKEHDSLPDKLILAFNRSLPFIKDIPNSDLIIARLKDCVFCYIVKILSNIYSSIDLDLIRQCVPDYKYTDEQLIDRLTKLCRLTDINIQIRPASDAKSSILMFDSIKSGGKSSMLDSSSKFYTTLYSELSTTINIINLVSLKEKKDSLTKEIIESQKVIFSYNLSREQKFYNSKKIFFKSKLV